MSWNPNAGQDPNQQSQYGGYSGYSSGQQQQQQYGTYQPPRSAMGGRSAGSSGASGATDPTSMGMNARNAALASYVLWWLTGLFFFIFERKNRFVRFHAAQSFLFFGAVSVVYTLIRLLTIVPLLGFLLSPVLTCATFIVVIPAILIWLFLMLQAYRGVTVKLPVFGEYAERLLARFSKKSTV